MFQWKQVIFIQYSLHATVVNNATQVAVKPIARAINSLRYLLPKNRARITSFVFLIYVCSSYQHTLHKDLSPYRYRLESNQCRHLSFAFFLRNKISRKRRILFHYFLHASSVFVEQFYGYLLLQTIKLQTPEEGSYSQCHHSCHFNDECPVDFIKSINKFSFFCYKCVCKQNHRKIDCMVQCNVTTSRKVNKSGCLPFLCIYLFIAFFNVISEDFC